MTACVPLVLFVGAEPPLKLADASLLAGDWKNDPGQRMVFKEHWSAATNGSMVGAFKMVGGGKPTLYEFLLIEEAADGTWMRLRHYGPGMVDKDEKPVALKLSEANDRKLVWDNPNGDKPKHIIYERDGEKSVVTVETMRDAKPAQFKLKFVRGASK